MMGFVLEIKDQDLVGKLYNNKELAASLRRA
jgi:hypothetical protein